MAELQQQMLNNGQELQTGDVGAIGQYALMDDRLLAEILRMLPTTGATIARCVLPFGEDDDSSKCTVSTNQTADALVQINPFRAVIASRTASGTDSLKAWRDIRSGVCVGGKGVWSATPPTALTSSQPITANGSGNARWDLIYAVIAPDVSQPQVTRAIKSPTTGVVSTAQTAVQLASTVSIAYLTGTPSANPVVPAVPGDGGGNYYIPLAYVMVPNGFGATSVVRPWMIMDVAPTPIATAKGLGGTHAAPANQLNVTNGQVLNSASIASWANNSTTSISARPDVYMPPGMFGCEMIYGGFDLTGTNSALWSHQSLSNVDTSRDWRNRFFMVFWQAQDQRSSGGQFSWSRTSPGGTKVIPTWSFDGAANHALAGFQYFTFGQSNIVDSTTLPGAPPANASVVSFVGSTQLSRLDSGSGLASVALYVDQTTGNMRVYINNTSAQCLLFFWLLASRPFGNY